jgi:hypothetical protein
MLLGGVLSVFGISGVIQVYRWLPNVGQDLYSAEAVILFFVPFIIGIIMITMGILAFMQTKRMPRIATTSPAPTLLADARK